MPRFNLDNYDEVKDRIPLFYKAFPKGRIYTEVINEDNTGVTIRASLFADAEEQKMGTPLVTGIAREFPGGHIDKYTENCETSAIGRAIANFNLLGKKGKKNRTFPSREEMESAQALIDQKEDKAPKQAQKPPKAEESSDSGDDVWEPENQTPLPIEEDAADVLWCPLHDTEWFKKGNMPGFAHPMADHGGVDGQWCNQPVDGLTEARFKKQCENLRWSLAYVEDELLMTTIENWQEMTKVSPDNYGPVLKECLRLATEEKGG
tara:strand:- start:73 stop:861 length:789 start_codon:yes stop_codon:yes gene_type:complete